MLIPLMEGGAAGSLGAADLEAMGFEIVAVNLLELAVSPGLDRLAAVGGLAAFTGWQRTICALALAGRADDPPRSGGRYDQGWRARRLPVVIAEGGGDLTLRSAVDGSQRRLSASLLERAAADLGATALADVVPAGRELTWWRSIDDVRPTPGWVVTAVPADAARDGLYWSDGGWQRIDAVDNAATPGPIDEGCACRACEIAGIGYVAHLWRQGEITASHLLGWHNLHQARLLVHRA